ncbi:hypothetical protein F5H01DRAFT_344962 [Linnemannia elongata]|nr:hypothetical protein F5H01DRAFT_344962 [Linnemannia elongata]
MFSGFSAWFAPELRSYKQTWVNHGGATKELTEADIAFVTDKTSSSESICKPTMKILRPDWIEDSIRGQKRLSLKRYKSVFPGLSRFDSSEHSNMAVGMEAFNSTKVITLDKSWQPHQPEPEIRDLSVTPSSGGASSHRADPTLGSVGGRRIPSSFQQSHSDSVSTGSVRTISLAKSEPEKAVDEEAEEDDIVGRDGLEEESVVATQAFFLTQTFRSSDDENQPPEQDISTNSMESVEIVDDSAPSEPRSVLLEVISQAPKRKRRLPPSILKTKKYANKYFASWGCLRTSITVSHTQANETFGQPSQTYATIRPPAQTHNSQVSDSVFGSSDDEVVRPRTSTQKRRVSSENSLERADTVPLSRHSMSSGTFYKPEDIRISNNAEGHDASHHQARRISAEDYLMDTLARLDDETKQLLSTRSNGVRLIDIERDNVDLRRKRP